MTLEAGSDFELLVEYLRDSRGFDFTGYKRASLMRRVAQRCKELGFDDFRTYHDYLQVHADEFATLFDKILINVTEFFRDRESWDYLKANVVPRITAKTGDIRVWSAGSSSGEEAYSAAMLLCDAVGEKSFLDHVKIYATDVDEQALSKARYGYSSKEMASVEESLRERYFDRVSDRFVFRAAPLPHRPPGRQETEPAVARGLGVGGDHRHAGPDQIRPVTDPLGVTLADDEHDGRVVRQ